MARELEQRDKNTGGQEALAGFLLVTTDPETVSGSRGAAVDLVRYRIKRGLWPIYRNTRGRHAMVPGRRLAFYIAGTNSQGLAGKIIATATIGRVSERKYSLESIDPEKYITDSPALVLHLADVSWLEQPLDFRSLLSELSFCPANMQKWGAVLQGGSRALSEPDWKVLFGG